MPKTLVREKSVTSKANDYAPVLRRMGRFGLPSTVVADASQQLASWSDAFFESQRVNLPAPSVFATRDGTIVFEWESGEHSLEVLLTSRDLVRFVLVHGNGTSESEEEGMVAPTAIPEKLARVFGL